MKILDRVNSPSDLKALTPSELSQLASEIREELVARVSENGGHLASNLGVVELTIALHKVFDSPKDKLIWDVGHQSYVHKLLTGRREKFATLRQPGGLSGFTSRKESEHDPFGAGHASTSISAALGMAIARDMVGDDYSVVAIIGDGAITGGMALEALNHAGHMGTRLIVVLNDNGMSISPTVGAISRLLTKIRFTPQFHQAEKGAKQVFARLPLGDKLWQVGEQVKGGLKGFLMPIMLWEELGFSYMGPIDGHNMRELEMALNKAREHCHKPTLVHVVTVKGKGYSPAEGNAVYFHGVPPNGGKTKTVLTYSEVFARTVLRLFRENPNLLTITPAMPEGNCLGIVQSEFPNRVFDVGICEEHAVTFAAGLATQGIIPIVAIYSTFLQRAFDQVVHDVCLQDLPVVFAIDRSGIVGDDGKTHQGTFDISYLSMIPNLVVSAPKDENELQHLLYTAVNLGHPMAVRYPRSAGIGIPLDEELHAIPVGEAEVLRKGKNIGIIAIGTMVAPALEAAQRLSLNGIEATVVNARFAKPLDSKLILDIARRTRHIITVEENTLKGGFGSGVSDLIRASGIADVKLVSLGIPDEFVEQGDKEVLRSNYGLDADGIVRRALALFPNPTKHSAQVGVKNTVVGK